MPTYDYKCDKCGHQFEQFQNMSDDPLHECPECSGPVQRLMGTGAGVIFKGSGFYETDYKRKNTSAACDGAKAGCTKAETCKSAQSDT